MDQFGSWGQDGVGAAGAHGQMVTESSELMVDDLLHRIGVELQLAPSQHTEATERYNSIADWLERDGSPLAPFAPEIYPQGSLRVGTTVRPVAQREFDLDLVCELQINPRSMASPTDLLVSIEDRLRAHGRYEVMLDPKQRNRCVRVLYANDFHLDIVPACPDPDPLAGIGTILIPDRTLENWQSTNPKGFARWFEGKAKEVMREVAKAMPVPGFEPVEIKPPLKRVVQLMKRWRDLAFLKDPHLAPSSIVLTTLAAIHYDGDGSPSAALSAILDAVIRSIPRTGRLVVMNPICATEDLSDAWDRVPGSYHAFVNRLVDFHRAWQVLTNCQGIHQATLVLKGLFGEEVSAQVVKAQVQMLEAARSAKLLGVDRRSGILRPANASGVVGVRPNTFYGD